MATKTTRNTKKQLVTQTTATPTVSAAIIKETPTQVAKTPQSPAPAIAVRQPAVLAESAKPTKPVVQSPRVKVPFVLLEPDARHVTLSGEFNGWSAEAAPMKRQANGQWETVFDLFPGRYQYKFVVDGQWVPDPRARENVLNQHGTLNSVIEVQAN